MNAFAKVLVFFVFLLSVGFAVSQMVLHARRVQYRRLYEKASAEAQSTKTELAKAKATLEEEKRLYDQSLGGLQGKLSLKEEELGTARAEIKRLESDNAVLKDDKRRFGVSFAQLSDTIKEQRKSIESLEAKNAELTATLGEKLATINERDRTVAALKEEVKGLGESLAKLKTELASVKQDRDQYEGIVSRMSELGFWLPPEHVKAIDAKVIRADPEYGLVIMDKGGEDGVKVNYPFTVYRDAEFIAKVIVYRVDDKVCLARVEQGMMAKGKQIQTGDDCTTRLVGAAIPFSVSER